MRLHYDMRIQVVQRAVSLYAIFPPVNVQALGLFRATTSTFGLIALKWSKSIHRSQEVGVLYTYINIYTVQYEVYCLLGLYKADWP